MHIEIEIPRPTLSLVLVAACVAIVSSQAVFQTAALGGTGRSEDERVTTVRDAEAIAYDLREEQEVLKRREDILRMEIDMLEEEIRWNPDSRIAEELSESRTRLMKLLQDERAAEETIAESLRDIRDAQGDAILASRSGGGSGRVDFSWPMHPELGISAYFDDASYEKRFGIAHKAIDIPAEQGSIVLAIADGVVEKVSDNGLGFNSIIIRHGGGYASLYGHVSSFLVSEGERVSAGDPIAKSGGLPGTRGAGYLTTGPHLHLEILRQGKHIDPLTVLPIAD